MNTQRNKEKAKTASDSVRHQILVDGGGKQYDVSLVELGGFLDELYNLGIDNLQDLNVELECLADFAMDGAPDHLPMSAIKGKLKLMRHIIFLFQSLLSEEK